MSTKIQKILLIGKNNRIKVSVLEQFLVISQSETFEWAKCVYIGRSLASKETSRTSCEPSLRKTRKFIKTLIY